MDEEKNTLERETPQVKPASRNPFGKLARGLARHKKLAIGAVAAAVLAGVVLPRFLVVKEPQDASGYSFVRTTSLARTTFREAVMVDGTVRSSNETSVAIDSAVVQYKVKTVDVQVGDDVKAGDVICTLDTTDLDKSIARAREADADTVTNLRRALETAQEAEATAQTSYDRAQRAFVEAWNSYEKARGQNDFDAGQKASLKGATDSLQEKVNELQKKMTDALNAYDDAVRAAGAVGADPTPTPTPEPTPAPAETPTPTPTPTLAPTPTPTSASTPTPTLEPTPAPAPAPAPAPVSPGPSGKIAPMSAKIMRLSAEPAATPDPAARVQEAYEAYMAAKAEYEAALAQLTAAQAATGYTAADAAKTASGTALEAATQVYQTAVRTRDDAAAALASAKKRVAQAQQDLEDAGASASLEDLLANREKCTIRANADGTVTSLSAVVGAVNATGTTLATIQNTEELVVAVSLQEYDVQKIRIGQRAVITSDATKEPISGVVRQLAPTANASGTFDAKVAIEGGANGLLIGMNATANIICTEVPGVFVAPLDAVGTNADGSRYVLVKTGGEGVDATFEPLAVTLGQHDDYNTVIEGAGLREGLEIRSTADMSVGMANGESASSETGAGIRVEENKDGGAA